MEAIATQVRQLFWPVEHAPDAEWMAVYRQAVQVLEAHGIEHHDCEDCSEPTPLQHLDDDGLCESCRDNRAERQGTTQYAEVY